MSFKILGLAMLVFGLSAIHSPGQFTTINVGQNAVGFTTTNSPGSYTIVGGGNDIWDTTDEFHFAYMEVTGNFDVTVRVESLTPRARWTKAGLMVRETLSEFSRMAFERVTPADVPSISGGNGANDTRFAYRTHYQCGAHRRTT